MLNLKNRYRKLTPFQILVLGFILIAAAGTVLLSLPISSSNGSCTPLIDAMFTAVSAVTTTGLVVVDTGSHYSFFGQLIILTLFQIGGLGYMIFIAIMVYIWGLRFSLTATLTFQKSIAGVSFSNMRKITFSILLFTFLFEFLGALVLAAHWMQEYSMGHALYLGLFHSVSAFCTAGFGLFPDSFSGYKNDLFFNAAISCICVTGGIGFFVLYDLRSYLSKFWSMCRPRRLSLHTKFVLIISSLLMLAGVIVIYFAEKNYSSQGLMYAAFQAISASSTTGFNTIDIGRMSATSLVFILILMFIGASSGGTGGGIKTTTFGVMMLSLIAFLRGNENVNVFRRRISSKVVTESFMIGFMCVFIVMLDLLVLSRTENSSFLQIFFETVSAIGTVGLSTGITPNLSAAGKIILSATMLFGRIGPLALGFSLFGKPRTTHIKCAEEEVFIG